MKRVAGGLLAIVGLIVLALKVGFMCTAWLFVTVAEWLDALDAWLGGKAAQLSGVKTDTEADDPEPVVPTEDNLDFHNEHCVCWRCKAKRG